MTSAWRRPWFALCGSCESSDRQYELRIDLSDGGGGGSDGVSEEEVKKSTTSSLSASTTTAAGPATTQHGSETSDAASAAVLASALVQAVARLVHLQAQATSDDATSSVAQSSVHHRPGSVLSCSTLHVNDDAHEPRLSRGEYLASRAIYSE